MRGETQRANPSSAQLQSKNKQYEKWTKVYVFKKVVPSFPLRRCFSRYYAASFVSCGIGLCNSRATGMQNPGRKEQRFSRSKNTLYTGSRNIYMHSAYIIACFLLLVPQTAACKDDQTSRCQRVQSSSHWLQWELDQPWSKLFIRMILVCILLNIREEADTCFSIQLSYSHSPVIWGQQHGVYFRALALSLWIGWNSAIWREQTYSYNLNPCNI